MPDLTEILENLVGRIDYPMFVVTATSGEERSGCLVGFVTQASIEPPRLMVFLSKANRTYRVARHSDALAVHFLSRNHEDAARLFGEETGDEVDKFAQVEWSPGPGGTPVLTRCRGWVIGRIRDRLDAGDHVGHLLDPEDARLVDLAQPQLSFSQVRNLSPGHPA